MSEVIPLLRKLQSANELPEQIAAAESLARLSEGAQPAIVALVQNCGSDNEDLRNWCYAALEEVGPPTVEQIEELALLASSASTNVAFWAATLLGRAGGLAKPAVPILSERSSDASNPEVQQRAAWALQRIQPA